MSSKITGLVFLLQLMSCKTADKTKLSNAESEKLDVSNSQGCEFAQNTWNNIYGSRYINNVNSLPQLTGEAATAFTIFSDPKVALKTFQDPPNDLNGEEIRRDLNGNPMRPKAIHAFGSVARIKFIVDPAQKNPYTGVFGSGAPCGLLRISLGVKPSKDGIIPAGGFKF